MDWLKNKYFTIVANACRFVLASVLVVSGFVKAVDPLGSMYKLQEYATAFSFGLISDEWLFIFGIVQAALEFLLGVFLLMGVYRKAVAFITPAVMLFFTVLTTVIYFGDNVSDCGCFGEAVTLSNGATLAKNIFLLLLSVIVMLGHRNFVRNVSSRSRWMVVLFAFFYIVLTVLLSASHLPVVDFGNYQVGFNLRAMTQGTPDEYRVIYRYERGEELCELPEGESPDSSWVCVGSRSQIIKEGTPPLLADFSIVDWEYDADMSEELLADTGYVCIVAVSDMDKASVSRVDKINDMYDYCLDNGVPFFVTTASDDAAVAHWCKRTGAEYPVYWTDELVLRNMVRANPGVLLLKDGVIVGKWNVADLPAVDDFAQSPTRMPDRLSTPVEEMRGWRFWMILLAVPLLLIALLDVFVSRNASKEKATSLDSSVDAADAKTDKK